MLLSMGALSDYIIKSRNNKKSIFYEKDWLVTVCLMLVLLIATISLFF